MLAKVHRLKHFNYRDVTFKDLFVITDKNGAPPILPLLYTSHLSRFGTVYELKTARNAVSKTKYVFMQSNELSDSTIRSYVYNLARFLNYLDQCASTEGTPGMHASSSCSERFVNHYLNDVLAIDFNSYDSLNVHCSALTAYFNWLDYMDIRPTVALKINRPTRQKIAESSKTQHYIQYVSRYARKQLLSTCETLGEKIIFRLGFEVGLRTSEVAGLRISGEGKLIDLFEKMQNKKFDHHDYFPYLLEGRYTKGGKSRWIYFDRELLSDMKRYFDTERKWLTDKSRLSVDGFLLRRDVKGAGNPISREHASRIFHKRMKEADLNPLLHYHDLRHTFATELFHAEISGNSGRETRSESAALIVVAQRLGHTFTIDGNAPPTTVRYIRMRLQMLEIDNEGH
jgi:site-specific recombinase XerD